MCEPIRIDLLLAYDQPSRLIVLQVLAVTRPCHPYKSHKESFAECR